MSPKLGDWGYLGVSATGLETLSGIPFHGEEHEEEEGHGEHEEERIFANTDSDSLSISKVHTTSEITGYLDRVDYYGAVTEYSLKEQHAEEAHITKRKKRKKKIIMIMKKGQLSSKMTHLSLAVINFVSDQYSQKMMLNAIQEDVKIIGNEAFMKPF